MKIIHALWYPVRKFSTGMGVVLGIQLLIAGSLFLFDACKKASHENDQRVSPKSRFLSALDQHQSAIGAVAVANHIKPGASLGRAATYTELESIYLEFPADVGTQTQSLVYNTNSIQELSDLIDQTDAVVQYEPTATNAGYLLQVPVAEVYDRLNPLIEESRQYLYAKGFTPQDIQDMLIEEGGTEEDLIPFAMALVQAESSASTARNYLDFFIPSAHAKLDAHDYLRCAAVAIGTDVLWSLSGSSASSWSVSAMKKAFGAVAKRMLGPIGVAIAAISFGVCILEANR